jgi:hypothetical protein
MAKIAYWLLDVQASSDKLTLPLSFCSQGYLDKIK